MEQRMQVAGFRRVLLFIRDNRLVLSSNVRFTRMVFLNGYPAKCKSSSVIHMVYVCVGPTALSGKWATYLITSSVSLVNRNLALYITGSQAGRCRVNGVRRSSAKT